MLSPVKAVDIGNTTWSDHALVTLTLTLTEYSLSNTRQWRLNESLLEDKLVIEDVIKELQYYFQYNITPEVDAGIIWEAHKTLIRGVLIKHGSRIKKAREAELTKILTDINALEIQHKQKPAISVETGLFNLRRQVTSLLHYRAKAALQFCWKYYYESGEKCGHPLARALQEQCAQSYIPLIVDSEGKKAHTPTQIASTFRRYYQSLYNLPTGQQPQHNIEEHPPVVRTDPRGIGGPHYPRRIACKRILELPNPVNLRARMDLPINIFSYFFLSSASRWYEHLTP